MAEIRHGTQSALAVAWLGVDATPATTTGRRRGVTLERRIGLTEHYVEMVGLTDRGRLRARNEDCLAVDELLGVAVVADGMGGLQDGNVASLEAVHAVMAYLAASQTPLPADAVEGAIAAANERVLHLARSRGATMGTTAVVLALDRGRCRIGHVGDSRAYRFRDGTLTLLTRDHSLVQEFVDRGVLTPEAARVSGSRHVVTRAIGLEAPVAADSAEFEPAPGDLLLLCTDGLWDMLEDDRIAALLDGCGPGRVELEHRARALVDAANEAGGVDNVTVVLARV